MASTKGTPTSKKPQTDLRKLLIEITSEMPMLMHADNIDWADRMEEWKNDPDNKAKSKAGDDRTPPWRWIGCLNTDDPENGVVTIPSEYIMKCIMSGAAEVPTGKGRKTFKELSQSGVLCSQFHWPLLINGKPIRMTDINTFFEFKTFKENVEGTAELGFSLFVKRVKIGQSKHIRVRPRFDNWSLQVELLVTDDQITDSIIGKILQIAGRLKGLGDWRPSAKTPGPWGTFKAQIIS